MVIEHFFTCPYCWQTISMLLELTEAEQSYIEDCEICCRPIQIQYASDAETLLSFEARSTDE